MKEYYLAIDIGASSGRHMLGSLENGVMQLEEVYRFENGMDRTEKGRLWNTERLFREILNGMKVCRELNKIPVSMSIDTWAVDYVLLDKENRILGETYGYRDHRTEGMDEKVNQIIPEADLYERTGIQKQIFNTIYQLMSVKTRDPDHLKEAKRFLMLPDYFQFLLTGNAMSEYTNGTSTQLVDPMTCQWDRELITKLGYPEDIFLPLQMPGTVVGSLKEEIQKEVGYDLEVVLCGSHDTASAVMAMPVTGQDAIYISSGTWSLMGLESEKALISEQGRKANLTNEGGYDHRFRCLKNIMGLWMIQSVRHETGDAYSFDQLCEMAEEVKAFPSRVDVNAEDFLSPDNMTEAIKAYCAKTGQEVPGTIGEISTVIYQSLAESYGRTVHELEEISGKTYDTIHIIGGGSKADYLNQLTANATGCRILAGPGEATAIGNLMAQMIHRGALADLKEARACVRRSFDIKVYEPKK